MGAFLAGITGTQVLYVTVPSFITLLIVLVGVLWHSGVDKGRDDERYVDTSRRLLRLETRVFGNGGNGNAVNS